MLDSSKANFPVLQLMPWHDPDGGVTLGTPDGAYWKYVEIDKPGKHACVIVVGPMRFCPLDYEIALCNVTDSGFCLFDVQYLAGLGSEDAKKIAHHRGFVSLKFLSL